MSSSNHDLTGRKHLVTNVLITWVAQGVYIAAGFVLPRTIDHNLGKDILGVWDFAWSLVGYFGLIQIGVVGSINRFVARYRAQGDVAGVNRAVSSVTCMLAIMSSVVLMVLWGVHQFVLPRYGAKLGANSNQAELVILILGSEVALQTLFAGYTGVLTGCHRWKLNTSLQAGGYAVSAFAMVVALLLGAQLTVIAAIHFVGLLITTVIIVFCAYRAYPQLQVKPSLASKDEALQMLGFGTKSFVPQMGELFLNQTVSVLILSYLGPAALAVYSRPRNLVSSMKSLVMKMGGVLLPSSGALEAQGEIEAIRLLAIKTTRYTAYMTVPIAVLLVVMGGPILGVWMGPTYRNGFLAAILSIGSLLNILQIPVFAILAGINRHGPPGWAHFASSVLTAGTAWVALAVLKCGLVGMAIGAVAPMVLLYVFYMPAYTARCLKIPVWAYLSGALTGPALTGLLFGICLLGCRLAFSNNTVLALVSGCGIGGLCLAPLYWRYALPESLKERFARLPTGNLNRPHVPVAPL
ncbi:MAG TPA: oligosaccharide flippase family protein [Verrucomicrobiae bacterium]|jgi:O-antigen/teichoic acid export membrane protein|nr:oligosaccharide flippase family protein [Verrucomicrobiae bacterium]